MIRYNDWAISFAENKRDGVTVCTIARLLHENGVPVRDVSVWWGGVAFCSVKDEYDKIKGMRLSLQRALADSDIPKCDHTAIWGEWVRRYVGNGKKREHPADRAEREFHEWWNVMEEDQIKNPVRLAALPIAPER